MSITRYQNGVNDHPNGWEGFRVYVYCKEGKPKQRYYRTTCIKTKKPYSPSKIAKIKKEAEGQHRIWMLEESKSDSDLNHLNIRWLFESTKQGKHPCLTVHIEKQIDNERFHFASSTVGLKKTFREIWDECLDSFKKSLSPTPQKIQQMQFNYPTFDELDEARIAFNKQNKIKFTKAKLKRCFK